jgi:hypothetical protein
VTDVANFSMWPIKLTAGTPLVEAEQVEEDWVCSVIDPGPEPVESGPKAPYQDALSWEHMAAATDKDIDKMVGRTDPELSAAEVEQLCGGGGVTVLAPAGGAILGSDVVG